MKKTKIFVRFISIITIFIFLITMLTGCSQKQDENNISEKIAEEIRYVENKIIETANTLNNLVLENDYISVQKINQNEEDSGSSKEESSSESKGESEGSSQSENGGQSSQEQNTQKTKVENTGVTTEEKPIDWEEISKNMEIIDTSWSSMILDLYKENVNNEDILGLSNELDKCIQFVNNKEKDNSLLSLAKIYTYLPKFAEGSSQDSKLINILKIKSNVLNSYAYVNVEDWDKVSEEIGYADNNFLSILNNVPENENSIYNINKGYILLKELQVAVALKDKSVYFVKYKNCLNELNKLS